MLYNRDLKTKCPKANDEILKMIKTNITTLKYYSDNEVTFNRTDLLESYNFYMYSNYHSILYYLYYLDKSIFSDIIPKITINYVSIPEDASFSVSSKLYKIGNKICEICQSYQYNMKCYDNYINNYNLYDYYFKARCDNMKYYTYPGSDKIYATSSFPIKSYVDVSDYNREYEYSSKKEEVVKNDLKSYDTIKMNKVYDDIYDGINSENGKLINSYNMSIDSNNLYLFTSNECSILYKEKDNRMIKIVYNYKLYGDSTIFTFNNVTLDETKTIFYFSEEQLTEEKIINCVNASKEYSYSELKTKECIKSKIEKYIKANGKPIFYINNYIYFQNNYVYIYNIKNICIY